MYFFLIPYTKKPMCRHRNESSAIVDAIFNNPKYSMMRPGHLSDSDATHFSPLKSALGIFLQGWPRGLLNMCLIFGNTKYGVKNHQKETNDLFL